MADSQSTQGELFPQGRICNRCKRHVEDATYKLCYECREELHARVKRKRAEAKASGMCRRCYKEPALEGLRNCAVCNESENERSREKIARARQEGKCIACGKQPEDGKKKCTECLIKFVEGHKEWREKAKSRERCCHCGKDNDRQPKVYCSSCATKLKAKRTQDKLDAFNAYGGPVCVCCGETTLEFLSMDHINNDGASHRKHIAASNTYRRNKGDWNGSGVDIYAWLRRNGYPEGFQVLCMNCNFAKGKYGECPHTKSNESVFADGAGI